MKILQNSSLPRHIGNSASTPALGAKDPSKATLSAPTIVASPFGKLDLKRRARLLGRLLGSVGPLALAVIGGGVFAKFLPNVRLRVVPVPFEDAALGTSSQIYELVCQRRSEEDDLRAPDATYPAGLDRAEPAPVSGIHRRGLIRFAARKTTGER